MGQRPFLLVFVGIICCAAATADRGGTPEAPPPQQALATTTCASLVGRAFGPATVTNATLVPKTAGGPAFCDVLASKTGRPDFEMTAQLPENWNGRLIHLGGSGLDGRLRAKPVWLSPDPLSQGTVTLSSNGGHRADPRGAGISLLNNDEGMIDYSWRAIGSTYDFGNALIHNYYDRTPEKSYFVGCSKGGTDAMKAASVYPDRYDGVIAQAPAPHIGAFVARIAGYSRLAPLTKEQWQDVYKAYVDRCDAKDGLTDGVVSNRAACDFSASDVNFLPAPQRQTVEYLTSDLKLRNGTMVNARYWWGPQSNLFEVMTGLGKQWLRYVVQDDPSYDPGKYTLDQYWPLISQAVHKYSLDVDPGRLASYLRRGGKILVFIGVDDSTLSIDDTVQFQHEVESLAGDAAGNSRMYLMPGVGHCGFNIPGDDLRGAESTDMLGAMQSWVETGNFPDALTATHIGTDGKVSNTRPLCPLGAYPRYTGHGDPDAAGNFVCSADGS